MRGDWLSGGVSWCEDRVQGEGEPKAQRGAGTTEGWSLTIHLQQSMGVLGTEEQPGRWRKREGSLGRIAQLRMLGALLILGEALVSKVLRERPRPPVQGGKRKAAWDIFRLGSRCL